MKVQLLYHYCSTETFFNIVKSSHIWLCNLFESNDYLERKWIDPMIHDVLNTLLKDHEGDNAAKTFKASVINYYELNRNINCYFTSFSEEGDMLSQWRGYADNGHGFAIGFDLECLGLPRQIPSMGSRPQLVVGLFRMIYDLDEIRRSIHAFILKCWEKFKADGFAENSTAMIECATMLVKVASAAKNYCFAEEKEWRILYTPVPGIISNLQDTKLATELSVDSRHQKYCVRDRALISSYFDLNVSSVGDKMPIRVAMLGPKNLSSSKTVERLLAESGYRDVQVRRSAASYR